MGQYQGRQLQQQQQQTHKSDVFSFQGSSDKVEKIYIININIQIKVYKCKSSSNFEIMCMQM